MIALCTDGELSAINAIINESAQAYKGVIPADRWHEPYMPMEEMGAEIARGVNFHGYYLDGILVAVMGIQEVKDVTLIRHAYVLTRLRGHGIGRKMLEHMTQLTARPILIGAWKAATWAVDFYRKNGFRLTDETEKNRLLKTYWTVSERQIEESVVLAGERWTSPGTPTPASGTSHRG
jgi:GNAT superfamily N-acetyltransferase